MLELFVRDSAVSIGIYGELFELCGDPPADNAIAFAAELKA